MREVRERAGHCPSHANLSAWGSSEIQSQDLIFNPYGMGAWIFRLGRLSWSRQEAEGIAAVAAGRDVLLALDFRAHRDLALSPDVARRRVLGRPAAGRTPEGSRRT